jgi:poly(A) polymerase
MEQAQKVPLSSPLSGEEIMELLEVPPGEKVGYWKKRLTEAVLEGEIPPGDKETARKWLLQHARPERSEP